MTILFWKMGGGGYTFGVNKTYEKWNRNLF